MKKQKKELSRSQHDNFYSRLPHTLEKGVKLPSLRILRLTAADISWAQTSCQGSV